MKKGWTKIFYRSFWALATMFMAILFTILLVGESIAMEYAGWINSYLDCETSIRVDNSADETPDVLYYKSDFMQYRWHYNAETEKYEFQTRWNQEGLYSYIKNVAKNVDTEGTVLLKNENAALPYAAGTDSHDALNNIIAHKGGTNTAYVDGTGTEKMSYLVRVDKDNFIKYSLSATTGEKIENHFDGADLNRYANTQDQKVTYLSRSDWASTYPVKAVSLTCTNSAMVADMQYGKEIEVTDDHVDRKGGVNIEGDHVGNINTNPNVVITYHITAAEEATVCLGATISEMPIDHYVTADTPIVCLTFGVHTTYGFGFSLLSNSNRL